MNAVTRSPFSTHLDRPRTTLSRPRAFGALIILVSGAKHTLPVFSILSVR